LKSIIVVDVLSTGYNYIEDIVRRGYAPVSLESKVLRHSIECGIDSPINPDKLYHQPVLLKEQDSYEKTLEEVKKYDPVLVVPGTESGVVLATKLAADLGLPGNPVEYIKAMTEKPAMHEALKNAGLRYLHGRTVSTPEEAIDFCKENGFVCAVVKPVRGAASQGLFLCDDLEEVKNAVAQLMEMTNDFGDKISEVLVQERIIGTEYVVNILSRNGFHKLTTFLKYNKIKTNEGGYIYDNTKYIDHFEPGHSELIEYAFKVADAIHYQNGMIHGEFMIDEKGPILIEVNCRPMGGSLPAAFADKISGQHETDSILDALLYPDKFMKELKKPYRLLRNGCSKSIIISQDMEVEDSPVFEVAKHLRSTYLIDVTPVTKPVMMTKTRDLEGTGGEIYLINDDKAILEEDLKILSNVEKSFFQFIFNDGMSRRLVPKKTDKEKSPEEVIKEVGCCGAVLVAADEELEIEGAQCITKDSITDAHKGFDFVIVNYKESLLGLKERECLKLMFDTFDLARQGGRVIVPKSSYDYLSYGRRGVEQLMTVKGLTVELIPGYESEMVIGTNDRN